MLTSKEYQGGAASIADKKKPVRVIAVTGGKGGVGKTNVSVNLAVSLAKMNQNVMLLDADLALANIDVLLGIQIKKDISHVLSGEADLDDIIIKGPAGIKIIPASSGVQQLTKLSQLELSGLVNAFSEVDKDLDVLIVDTAAGIGDDVLTFARASQEMILVVCDEPTSITDAYASIKAFSRDNQINHYKILVNMVRSSRDARETYAKLIRATDRFLDVTLEYVGYLPFDDHLKKAVQKQKSVVDVYPGCDVSKSFKKLAMQITDWPINNTANDQVKFFLERLVA